MATSSKKVNDCIVKNTCYLIKSREESKLSFSERAGITRSTIYKIINGNVKKIQRGTVEKIADFFGVSVKLLEEYDIASIEASEVYPGENINPVCVPVIPESEIADIYTQKISKLLVDHASTYCYTIEKNIICVKLHSHKALGYSLNELIFIRRFFSGEGKSPVAIIQNGNLIIKEKPSPHDCLLGYIVEERMYE
jgi:transcriptional regulator with XRE-family HTH domain